MLTAKLKREDQPPPPPPFLPARFQTRTAQAECEPGYYCLDGVRLPCPAGTFGLSGGLTSPSCSGPCPAGYMCGIGVAELLLGETCGGASWYCPVGSSSRSEVGVGNFTIGEPPDRRVAQVKWPCLTFAAASINVLVDSDMSFHFRGILDDCRSVDIEDNSTVFYPCVYHLPKETNAGPPLYRWCLCSTRIWSTM